VLGSESHWAKLHGGVWGQAPPGARSTTAEHPYPPFGDMPKELGCGDGWAWFSKNASNPNLLSQVSSSAVQQNIIQCLRLMYNTVHYILVCHCQRTSDLRG